MKSFCFIIPMVILVTAFTGCVSAPRFTSSRPSTQPAVGSYSMVEEGIASYYGSEFDGRPTSSGEIFDKDQLTAAHRTFPFNTKLKVTNLANGRSVVVRVNDRGPFVTGRIIDLSYGAAKEIQLLGTGTAKVRLEVIELGKVPTRK
jgi:peptidoglycan lytic transglycosylase